jgi:hypothetical protein
MWPSEISVVDVKVVPLAGVKAGARDREGAERGQREPDACRHFLLLYNHHLIYRY